MSKKTRAITFGAFVSIFLMAYMIGNSYIASDEEAETFLKDFQSSTEGVDAIGIFTHNSIDALPMFIPGFGMAWGAFIGWQTGAAFSTLLSSNPALSDIPPISLLLGSPFGILELVAYSLGMSRSFILIRGIIKKRSLKKEIRHTLFEIGIAIGILLVAGFVEFSMITPQHISLSS